MKKLKRVDIKSLKEKGMTPFKGFIEFIESQGVVGLAIGVVMGTSVAKLVTAFVTDLINPIIGLLLGSIGDLENVYLQIGSVKILFGSFISSLIDFIIVVFVIYLGVKILSIGKNKEKEK